MPEAKIGEAGLVSLWEALVRHTLSAERRAQFLARDEVSELSDCSAKLLELAGTNLLRRTGELRLESWLAELPRARRSMRDVPLGYSPGAPMPEGYGREWLTHGFDQLES